MINNQKLDSFNRKLTYFKMHVLQLKLNCLIFFNLVVVNHSTFLYSMQFDQSEYRFTDGMLVNLRVRSSNLNIL